MFTRVSWAGPILVTGAGGFIGRRLLHILQSRGHVALGWSRAECDLADASMVADALSALKPATIFHLAAISPAPADGHADAASREVAMLAHLSSAMSAHTRLIYTGSMSEYGRSGRFAEHAQRTPHSAYGFAKAKAVDFALGLAERGQDVRVARLFGVFGPGEGKARLVPHLVAHLANNLAVPLRGAEQVRDLVHVDDICDRMICLAGSQEIQYPVVNIGTGVGVSIELVCRRVAAILDADPRLLQFDSLPRRAIDEDELIADTTLLAALGPVPSQHWLQPIGPARTYVEELATAVRQRH